MDNSKKGSVETTTLSRVPENEKKSWIDVAFIHAGVMICVPSLLLGGLLAGAMPLSNALIAGTLGYVLAIVLTSITALQGSDLGVPSCVVVQSCFGKKGARFLISILFTLSLFGWFGVNTSVCGAAFSNLMAEFLGINIATSVSVVIWGIIMLITAVYGINALNQLNKISVPALIIVTVIGCVLAVKSFGTENLFVFSGEATMTMLGGVALTVSFMTVGIVTAADFTRYQTGRKNTLKATIIGTTPPGIMMLLMGCIMSRVTGEYDISIILCQLGIPLLGMTVLILATWTTNTTNAYCAGLNLVMIFNLKDEKRALVTMIAGVIGTALAVMGVMDNFETFLNWIGNAFSPIAGVMMADYWILCKGKPENWHPKEGVDILGIVSWALGFAIILIIPAGFPIMQGLVVSFAAYYVLNKVTGRKGNIHGQIY